MPTPNRRPAPKPVPRPTKIDPRRIAAPVKQPLEGRSRELNGGAPDGWVRYSPATVGEWRGPALYAVIGSWHEADVIEATVKNCLANGCSKVFLVDNDSPDDTKEVAKAAGAVIARNYRTTLYDDDLRLKLMNEVVREVTAKDALPELWWLFLDADEFCCGPDGQRVLDYVKSLDPRVNYVGADCVDLYPTLEPHYAPGMHPADCMTDGLKRVGGKGVFCDEAHWKHPLFRTRDGVVETAPTRGSHVLFVPAVKGKPAVRTLEPKDGLVMFHAPIRGREATFRRLEVLCAKKGEGGLHRSAGDEHIIQNQGAVKRWRCLEHIYRGEWDKVELPHAQVFGGDVTGIALFPWRRLRPRVKDFPRWYSAGPKEEAPRKVELPLL